MVSPPCCIVIFLRLTGDKSFPYLFYAFQKTNRQPFSSALQSNKNKLVFSEESGSFFRVLILKKQEFSNGCEPDALGKVFAQS